MIIYLYVKTHNKTGLKYLGKTKRKDPYKYQGSGDYWNTHINKHGYDVTTEILKECTSNEEVKEWGLYYSNLWNIVHEKDESGKKTWANLKPENGDGGATACGSSHPMKKIEHRRKLSGENHYSKKDGYEWKLKGPEHPMKNLNNRTKLQGENHYSKQQEFTGVLFGGSSTILSQESIAKRSGDNHYTKKVGYISRNPKEASNYDHTIYTWEHIITKEIVRCTRYEFIHSRLNGSSANVSNLINNKQKVRSIKGWRIINTE